MSNRRSAPRAEIAAIVLCVVALFVTNGCGRSTLDDEDLFGSAGGGSSGGVTGEGGNVSSGGRSATGGRVAVGGTVSTGGRFASGGNFATGGRVSTGGRVGAGGSGAGGVFAGGAGNGGAGGAVAGGAPATGGNPGVCAASCNGCCDAVGRCRSGDSASACGDSGVRCTDCGSSGFGCVNGACQGTPPACGPSNCDGCCDALGRCRDGTEIDACGSGGGACLACTSPATGCRQGACTGAPPPCGPGTCGGCCSASGSCMPGTADGACGIDGESCESCSTRGGTCNQPGSYCTFVPSCSATTCPDGCCDSSGVCRNGRTDAACGDGGGRCRNCASTGEHCAATGFCYTGPHCGPDNCGGCCTANGQCVTGASNARCGIFGALCDNCSSQGETCQNGACGAPGATCPVPYGGCNPGALTTPPPVSTSCTRADLAKLASACNGPRATAACRAELAALLRASPACFDCLQPFVNPGGVAACLAPFLNATCNHDLTCSLACANVACGSCTESGIEACQDQAFTAAGTCGAYVNGNYCAIAAFGGPGGFCDLDRLGDVGVWLQGVGAYYCSG